MKYRLNMAKGPRATVKPASRVTMPNMNLLDVSTCKQQRQVQLHSTALPLHASTTKEQDNALLLDSTI